MTQSDILDKILAVKREEVAIALADKPLAEIRAEARRNRLRVILSRLFEARMIKLSQRLLPRSKKPARPRVSSAQIFARQKLLLATSGMAQRAFRCSPIASSFRVSRAT